MSYRYTCQICGSIMRGDTEDGVVQTAKHHYVNQHGLSQRTDRRTPRGKYDEDDIKEEIEEFEEE